MLQWLIIHSPLLYLTQSFWRDEAFSVIMGARPISFFMTHLSFEPPFYYLLLHFWMKLFGQSEVAVRSLSLVAFALTTGIVICWSEKLFKNHWLSWWFPLFFFFNPMLLYYSMEARTYGWYMFFATLSLWAYTQRRWVVWIIATVLGFYNHTYLIIVPFALTLHYCMTHRKTLFRSFSNFWHDPMIRSIGAVAVCITPWFIILLKEIVKLRQSWYYPVDVNLITSVLGNLFVGYEGTPWYLWGFTKVLSLFILTASFVAYRTRRTQKSVGMFLSVTFIPLIAVIGISIFKPLYVNRYVIPVSIAEVFLIAFAIRAINDSRIQKIVGAVCLLFILGFNIWYPSKHAKLNIRATITQVNALKGPKDVIMTDSPLIFFETTYYSKDRHVYLYNPNNNPFPWYVGDAIFSSSQMVTDYPPYPMRGFLIHANGTFDIVFKAPISKQITKPSL